MPEKPPVYNNPNTEHYGVVMDRGESSSSAPSSPGMCSAECAQTWGNAVMSCGAQILGGWNVSLITVCSAQCLSACPISFQRRWGVFYVCHIADDNYHSNSICIMIYLNSWKQMNLAQAQLHVRSLHEFRCQAYQSLDELPWHLMLLDRLCLHSSKGGTFQVHFKKCLKLQINILW